MDKLNTYKALFDNSIEGVIYVDAKGEILMANPSFLTMFGYQKKEEILGKKIEMFIPKKMQSNHVKNRIEYVKKPKKQSMSKRKTLRGLRKDGSEFPIDISLSHYKDSETGELVVLAIVFDVTEKRKYEENEQNLLREKELVELKARFVSMASHEFRTPLSTIKSSTGLMQKYHEIGDSKKIEKHATRIKSSISHLIHLLDDVLLISKQEEGIKTNTTTLNIKEFAEQICEQMQGIVSLGQIIKLNFKGKNTFKIDENILRTILTNLISNAIKYSYKFTEIFVNISNDNELKISVIDQGIGIPLKDQSKLYERFFRAGNVPNIEGTGLGLSIIKKHIESLNGSITFKSEPKVKTEFTVKIPQ